MKWLLPERSLKAGSLPTLWPQPKATPPDEWPLALLSPAAVPWAGAPRFTPAVPLAGDCHLRPLEVSCQTAVDVEPAHGGFADTEQCSSAVHACGGQCCGATGSAGTHAGTVGRGAAPVTAPRPTRTRPRPIPVWEDAGGLLCTDVPKHGRKHAPSPPALLSFGASEVLSRACRRVSGLSGLQPPEPAIVPSPPVSGRRGPGHLCAGTPASEGLCLVRAGTRPPVSQQDGAGRGAQGATPLQQEAE